MKYLCTFIFLCFAGGCYHYQDSPILPSNKLKEFDSRRLDNDALKIYIQGNSDKKEWPLKTWDLSDLTLVGFFYNTSLDVARAQYAVSKGNLKAAGQLPNPSVSVSPGYNSSNPSDSGVSSWIVDTALEIPFETAGKRGYKIAQANQLSESARLKIATAAWQVRSVIRQALLDIYGATRTEELLLIQQRIQSDNVRLLQLQQEAGEVSPFEVSQARIELNTSRLAYIDAQKQKARAMNQLANAIGVPVGALDDVEFSFDSLVNIPQNIAGEEARQRAMLGRADLLGALAEYQASQSALQLEIAKQYPDINIGPAYSFDQSENKWFLGVSMTLPILNQNQGHIAAAEGARRDAAAKFNALQADIIAQINEAVSNYQISVKKLQTAQSLTEELKKKAEDVRKMYEAGEILKLAVASAELEVITNELAQLNADIEMLEAVGQIEDAIQQPLDLSKWQEIITYDTVQ